MQIWLGDQFPYGTIFVNAAGSAAFGVFVVLLEKHTEARLLILSGFMGAFTTFSTKTPNAAEPAAFTNIVP